jgi:hypothetical protein
MIQIKKILAGFPAKEATGIEIAVITFKTDAVTALTFWQLFAEDNELLSKGNYELTPEQYEAWGDDNTLVENSVLSALGLQRA